MYQSMLGWTDQKFAESCGVDQKTIDLWIEESEVPDKPTRASVRDKIRQNMDWKKDWRIYWR